MNRLTVSAMKYTNTIDSVGSAKGKPLTTAQRKNLIAIIVRLAISGKIKLNPVLLGS